MKLIQPVLRTITRPLSLLVLVAWVVCMAVLVNRSYLEASPANLATDLAQCGPTATWRGVYYQGENIGYTVNQTIRTDEGFELQEDSRLVMNLFGSSSTTRIHTTAWVDTNFSLRSFESFMIFAVLYIIGLVILLGWPSAMGLLSRLGGIQLSAMREISMAGSFLPAIVLSVVTW